MFFLLLKFINVFNVLFLRPRNTILFLAEDYILSKLKSYVKNKDFNPTKFKNKITKDKFVSIGNQIKDNDLSGLFSQFFALERCLKTGFSGNESFLDIIKQKRSIIFSIGLEFGESISAFIGKFIINEIKTVMNTREWKENVSRVPLILDEFGLFANESIENLINKGRSSGIELFLSFQSFNDLNYKQLNQQFSLQMAVFSNTHNFIYFHQTEANTAEYIAKTLGTYTESKKTTAYNTRYNSNSYEKGSERDVQEFIIHPNELKNLGTGEVAVDLMVSHKNRYKHVIKIKNFNINNYNDTIAKKNLRRLTSTKRKWLN